MKSVTADMGFEAFEALWLNGQVAMQLGKPGLAVDLFTRAMQRRPDAVAARMALGGAQMELQRYDEALRTFQSVLDGDPDNAAARERVEMLPPSSRARSR